VPESNRLVHSGQKIRRATSGSRKLFEGRFPPFHFLALGSEVLPEPGGKRIFGVEFKFPVPAASPRWDLPKIKFYDMITLH
jgi:hypothetical protein